MLLKLRWRSYESGVKPGLLAPELVGKILRWKMLSEEVEPALSLIVTVEVLSTFIKKRLLRAMHEKMQMTRVLFKNSELTMFGMPRKKQLWFFSAGVSSAPLRDSSYL